MRVVIKVGGSVLGDIDNSPPWMTEIQTFLGEGHQVAIVHGGGPAISRSLKQANVPVKFHYGQRVTTPEVLQHVLRILRGEMNALLVNRLNAQGIRALGLCGMDGSFMTAEHLPPKDLGYVGIITHVAEDFLDLLWSRGLLPVIAPLAPTSDYREILNCNGDGVAEAVASGISADTLVFYTTSGGLREGPDVQTPVVPRLSREEIGQWIQSGKATEGMIPKLQAAERALRRGVRQVMIGSFYDRANVTTQII